MRLTIRESEFDHRRLQTPSSPLYDPANDQLVYGSENRLTALWELEKGHKSALAHSCLFSSQVGASAFGSRSGNVELQGLLCCCRFVASVGSNEVVVRLAPCAEFLSATEQRDFPYFTAMVTMLIIILRSFFG
jgi:hypothetical protein